MDMADMAWEVKCQEEDMKQRALENERHAIEDARRSVDEKAQQLQVLANQSALFAGFSMVSLCDIPSKACRVGGNTQTITFDRYPTHFFLWGQVVLVESQIPENVPVVLLTIFGGTTACVIALMLVSSLYAMYILVAILRYDCVTREVNFDEFWQKRCEPDFKTSL